LVTGLYALLVIGPDQEKNEKNRSITGGWMYNQMPARTPKWRSWLIQHLNI
jgi:hypothetical protein